VSQPSRTNRPRGLASPGFEVLHLRATSKQHPITQPLKTYCFRGSPIVHRGSLTPRHKTRPPNHGCSLPASIARGPHPFPSRTRSLSLAARMVLPGPLGGRVRRRRLSSKSPSASYEAEGLFGIQQLHARIHTTHTRNALSIWLSAKPSEQIENPSRSLDLSPGFDRKLALARRFECISRCDIRRDVTAAQQPPHHGIFRRHVLDDGG
jgi:hypothetical protein